jgi:hypothetical protein
MEITPALVAEKLRAVAADIRRYGHFQGGAGGSPKRHAQHAALYDHRGNPAGLCCVNVNPTRRPRSTTYALEMAIGDELKRRISLHNQEQGGQWVGADAVAWNDRTPTDEVLKILESA